MLFLPDVAPGRRAYDASVEDLALDEDGRDVTNAFATMPDSSARGLVVGLDVGGQSFSEVFTEDQQAMVQETFPDGVCHYSRPGKGLPVRRDRALAATRAGAGLVAMPLIVVGVLLALRRRSLLNDR